MIAADDKASPPRVLHCSACLKSTIQTLRLFITGHREPERSSSTRQPGTLRPVPRSLNLPGKACLSLVPTANSLPSLRRRKMRTARAARVGTQSYASTRLFVQSLTLSKRRSAIQKNISPSPRRYSPAYCAAGPQARLVPARETQEVYGMYYSHMFTTRTRMPEFHQALDLVRVRQPDLIRVPLTRSFRSHTTWPRVAAPIGRTPSSTPDSTRAYTIKLSYSVANTNTIHLDQIHALDQHVQTSTTET